METKEEFNARKRAELKRKFVKTVAIGITGVVIYNKVMHRRGYKMVRPGNFDTETGILQMHEAFGKTWNITPVK